GGGFFDPYLKSHITDPRIRAIYNDEFMQAQEFSLLNGVPDFYLDGRDEYFDALKEGIMAAYLQETSPKQALDLIAKEWDLITAKKGFDEQRLQWLFLREHYPDSIKGYLK
ncbi:MAG: transcriptional antiterminator, partial [gamma proteobacterium symbiont of Phacoides pectinatus]